MNLLFLKFIPLNFVWENQAITWMETLWEKNFSNKLSQWPPLTNNRQKRRPTWGRATSPCRCSRWLSRCSCTWSAVSTWSSRSKTWSTRRARREAFPSQSCRNWSHPPPKRQGGHGKMGHVSLYTVRLKRTNQRQINLFNHPTLPLLAPTRMSTVFVSLSGITFFLKSSSRILNLRFSLEPWILQASDTSAWWRTWVDFWVFSKFLFGPGTRQWQGTLKYLASNGKIQSLPWNFFFRDIYPDPIKMYSLRSWDVWSRASLGHLDRVFQTYHSSLGQCSWCRQPGRRRGWSSSSEPGRIIKILK